MTNIDNPKLRYVILNHQISNKNDYFLKSFQ